MLEGYYESCSIAIWIALEFLWRTLRLYEEILLAKHSLWPASLYLYNFCVIVVY